MTDKQDPINDNIKEIDKKLNWLTENLTRVMTYINTLEHWRHMSFTPKKEENDESEKVKKDDK